MASLDLDNLRWLLQSPGLLRSDLNSAVVTDEFLRALGHQIGLGLDPSGGFSYRLSEVNAESLTTSLDSSRETRRLGRYFESLTSFMIAHFLQPSRLEVGVLIRAEKRTIGELDILFSTETPFDEHWELSVKFYLCLHEGSSRLQDFMGTFVEDRLDRKLAHLFVDQLPLVETPEAGLELSARGWTKPFTSRALMKGLFFYPARGSAWRLPAGDLPSEISTEHERGWWTTSSELCFPRVGSGHYIRLGQLHWLSRFHGSVAPSEIMTADDLRALCASHFAGAVSGSWLRRRELTVAEVEILPSGFVRELARGHIVHTDWPALGAWAAARTVPELELSQREFSRRPRG